MELHVLWPNYLPNSNTEYLFNLIEEVNGRFKDRIPVWQFFIDSPEHFSHFFNKVLQHALDKTLSFIHQTAIVTFLDNCFNSLEIELVRQEVAKLCSLPIWINLLPSRREELLDGNLKVKKYWLKTEKKIQTLDSTEFERIDFNRRFLWRLLQHFKRVIDFIDDESKDVDINAVAFCERFLLLLIDLEAQLITRRFFNALLISSHAITHLYLSQFISAEHGTLVCELLTLLKFYCRFEIDDLSGMPLTMSEVIS